MKLYIPSFFFSFLFELAFLDDQMTSPICTYFSVISSFLLHFLFYGAVVGVERLMVLIPGEDISARNDL
jgi:hypothetical protein